MTLASLDLQSPEELRRSLAELQAVVTAEREAAAAAEQRCRELANREQAIVKVRGSRACIQAALAFTYLHSEEGNPSFPLGSMNT